jgi:hypothetical protein
MWHDRVGQYEDRLKNFYVTFSLLIRAVNKAAHIIANYNYTTDSSDDTKETQELIWRLLNVTSLSCELPFNENELFATP